MIRSFKHAGLAVFYESGSKRGIQPKHAEKLREMLTALDSACVIGDLDLPGYGLHQLVGSRAKVWSIKVNANWRVTFEFSDGDVFIVNYEDYH